jgi:hypothetical protein
MPSSICPRCGKQTDGVMVDQDLYIIVTCDKCEVILGILPKFYQKATWKAPKTPAQVEDEGEEEVAVASGKPKEEPGAATIRALEKKKRTDDRRLRWS